MSQYSSPPASELEVPPRFSKLYRMEPQPFGSYNEDGSVKEEATLDNVEDPKEMYSILKPRQMAYAKAEIRREEIAATAPRSEGWSKTIRSRKASLALRDGHEHDDTTSATRRRKGQPNQKLPASRTRPGRKVRSKHFLSSVAEHPEEEREAEQSGNMVLQDDGITVVPMAELGRTRAKANIVEPIAGPQPTQGTTKKVPPVKWSENIELKIGLRMVFEEYKGNADLWNEVFKDEPSVAARDQPVPVANLQSQWNERGRDLSTTGVRQWKEIVMPMQSTDPRWVSMEQRFKTAIAKLGLQNALK